MSTTSTTTEELREQTQLLERIEQQETEADWWTDLRAYHMGRALAVAINAGKKSLDVAAAADDPDPINYDELPDDAKM